MSKYQAGQQIKILAIPISGTVIGPRHADDGTDMEGRLYQIRISEQIVWINRDHLTPIDQAAQPRTLTVGSPEWIQESDRFIESLKTLQQNPHDLASLRAYSEAGSLLGYVISTP